MGQKTGEKWTAAAKLQPTFPKSDRLLEQHHAGKVRIIAVAGAKRAPQLPDVPTLREQGVALDAGAWFAM